MKAVTQTLSIVCALVLFMGNTLTAQRAIFVEETYADADFDLSNSEIPSWELIPGGPGKDGIPALTDPSFTLAKKDKWLADDDRVIGITRNGVSKAYPISILNYHEVINDDFKGERVAITYSPLCGSVMVYRTETGQEQWELAVSGLLYNNNALYYDRNTQSLWSQLHGRAVAGPVAGAELDLLPSTYTTWGEWKERNPETLLLASETGYNRNYEMDSYAHYATTDRLMFPLNYSDERLNLKERVLGVNIDGVYKAYPYKAFSDQEDSVVQDVVNGQTIQIEFLAQPQAAYVTDLEGTPLPSSSTYWFAWSSFHPETALFNPETDEFTTDISMSLGMVK
ncbi:MAG: DUF3179 domain-containing protein [Bacteroidota bacterium]